MKLMAHAVPAEHLRRARHACPYQDGRAAGETWRDRRLPAAGVAVLRPYDGNSNGNSNGNGNSNSNGERNVHAEERRRLL
jgi:hypothetical protein